jgi:hypothetical protein
MLTSTELANLYIVYLEGASTLSLAIPTKNIQVLTLLALLVRFTVLCVCVCVCVCMCVCVCVCVFVCVCIITLIASALALSIPTKNMQVRMLTYADIC